MLHPDDKQRTQKLVRRHLKENEPYDIDFRLRRKSGNFGWFQSRGQAIRNELGQPTRMTGSIRDITNRKQAEEALRKSEERFRSVFKQAGVAVGVVESQTGRFVQINSKYEELIGYSNEEMTGKTWMEISHPDDIEEDLEKSRDLNEGEINRFSMEKRLIHKDGSLIWINLTVSPIGNSQEIPEQHIVIVEDITERKRLEEEAHEHRERLAHVTRLSTLGEMATGLAHEINQPLAGIGTYASACLLLLRATDPFPEREKLIDILGKIEVQSRRAGEIIHGLRKLVAKRESVHTSFSINQSVDNALALTESEARTQDIHVRRELASDLPRIHGDEIQIEQVILNLVCNAIEALRESESNRREILVRTSQDEQLIVVDICDTGPGINADDVERVLDAFVSTKDEGMGLGLSISRSIIEAHGGRLWVEPNPDCGVTFYVNLPTSQDADS